MKRILFGLIACLLWAAPVAAQWFRDDCADLNSTAIAGVTDCVQNTTVSGRIAGRTYTFIGGTAWREKASISEVNPQTGTSYTFVNADSRKLVTFSNASPVAAGLPQAGAGATFLSSWYVDVQNRGAGTVTITPVTSNIDGASSLALTTNQGVRIYSDGAQYYTQRGVGSASGGVETDPIIRGINGLVKCDGANCSAGVPNTDYPALAHATRHQSGGADEVATATPATGAIPKGGTGGQLNQGWAGTGLYNGSQHYIADAGSNDTYTGCTANPINTYVTGSWIDLRPNTINTGAATVNVCSLGARPIVQHDNSVLTDGLLASGRPYRLTYDGTSFRMAAGGTGGGGVSLSGSTAGRIPRITGANALGESGLSDDGAGGYGFGDVSGNRHRILGASPTGVRVHTLPDIDGDIAQTSGAFTTDNCVKANVNDVLVDSGAPCGGSGVGTIFMATARNGNIIVGTTYWNPTAHDFSNFGAASDAAQPMPGAGTARNLYVRINNATVPASETLVITLMKNGSATALTCSIAAAGATCSDTSNTVSFAAGDLWTLRSGLTGGATAVDNVNIAFQFN